MERWQTCVYCLYLSNDKVMADSDLIKEDKSEQINTTKPSETATETTSKSESISSLIIAFYLRLIFGLILKFSKFESFFESKKIEININ